jgi:hypothetical protein
MIEPGTANLQVKPGILYSSPTGALQHPPASPNAGPGSAAPTAPTPTLPSPLPVRRRDRLGGLIHEYSQVA